MHYSQPVSDDAAGFQIQKGFWNSDLYECLSSLSVCVRVHILIVAKEQVFIIILDY